MIVPFDTMKTIQAAAVLLKCRGGQMGRMRLLKLLYIADRESIAETLRPITGDDAAAMDHGPVPSKTYNLLKQTRVPDAGLWATFIAKEGERDHRLISDPGEEKLSEYEVRKLMAVCHARNGMKDYEIADETHKFPEWIKNQPPEGSSEPISMHDVLAALDMGNYESKLAQELEADLALAEALAGAKEA